MAAGKPKGAKRPPPKSNAAKSNAAKSNAAKSNAAKRRASGSASNRNRPAAQRSRQDRERQALRNRLIAGAVVLVIIGALVFSAARPKSSTSSVGPLDAGAGNCTLDSKADPIGPDGVHVPNPTYKVEPPAGGSHLLTVANPGFYRAGQAPPDGELVHAMEHGFVVLWYRSDLSPAKLDQISALSDRFGRELIVAPRPALKGEVAVTAWHKRLLCGELVPEKVAEFARKYKDKGPEKGFL